MSITYKKGRIVIILNGRYSGCKAVIIDDNYIIRTKSSENINSVILLGIHRYSHKINKKMSNCEKIRKTKLKIFFKNMNKCHFIPTRYNLDFGDETSETVRNFAVKYLENKTRNSDMNQDINYKSQKKMIRNILTDKFVMNKNQWFFDKLKF